MAAFSQYAKPIGRALLGSAMALGGSSAALPANAVAADTPDGPNEDNDLAQARDQALERLNRMGANLQPGDVVTQRLSNGDIVTYPHHTALKAFEDGSAIMELSVDTGAIPGISASSDAPYWHTVDTRCYDRQTNYGAYFDVCAKASVLINDGDSLQSYATIDHYGTSGSIGGATEATFLRSAATDPKESYKPAYVQWDPSGDFSGDCASTNLTVGAGLGAGYAEYSHTVTHCETWTFRKGDPANNPWVETIYRANFATTHARENAHLLAIAGPDGARVTFTTESAIDGCCN